MRRALRLLWRHKAWWLIPLAVAAAVVAAVIFLAMLSPASPFRYTLF